jgi:RNA polymerase sigma-70 factor (ECF subfamily)
MLSTVTELELAARCLRGDPEALTNFEDGALRHARDHLAELGFAASAVDEAIQRARTKLLVERGLESFRGRGPLAMFVRTAAVRLAIDVHRQTARDVDLGHLVAAPCADPELEYMRKLYAQQLVGAVRDAWARLAAHERFLLALRIYEAVSIDDVARIYQIHRASAARRAAAARSALIAHTRACLRERLAVGDETLDSILRIVTTSVQLPLDEPLEH